LPWPASLSPPRRRTLCATLSPSTTLVRSVAFGDALGDPAVLFFLRERRIHDVLGDRGWDDDDAVGVGDDDVAGLYGRAAEDVVEDRKSTRLNSRHVSTSYAVFCLNKRRRA